MEIKTEVRGQTLRLYRRIRSGTQSRAKWGSSSVEADGYLDCAELVQESERR